MIVNCIQCPKCKEIIYSRARHDFIACSCSSVYIDGGSDYMRVGFAPKFGPPKSLKRKIKATKAQLYNDWNIGGNKYGIIK